MVPRGRKCCCRVFASKCDGLHVKRSKLFVRPIRRRLLQACEFSLKNRERQFPLQIRTADGVVFALEQIRDEPQPESSFELPAGYRKFSPEALIERIKQSDVWVARPGDTKSGEARPGGGSP